MAEIADVVRHRKIWDLDYIPEDATYLKRLRHMPCGGAYKTCSCCGKTFYILNVERYVYKKSVYIKSKRGGRDAYFCSWHCKRQYEAEHPDKRKRLHCD